jgi:PAS domain S-box-containing protein
MKSNQRRSDAATSGVDARNLDAFVDAIRSQTAGRTVPLRVINGYIARSPFAVLLADDAGCYVAANDAACELTGFSREELLQRSVADLTAPRDAAVTERLWNSFVRADHQRGAYAILRKDGVVVPVLYDAYADVAAGVHVSFLRPVESDASRR